MANSNAKAGGPMPKGPGGPGPRGPKPQIKNPGKLLARIMQYVFKDYFVHCILVVIFIFEVYWQMFREPCLPRT